MNGAGLSKSTTSAGILKDSSPPAIQAVHEVDEASDVEIDYQVFNKLYKILQWYQQSIFQSYQWGLMNAVSVYSRPV